jgi:outer membrane receptor protein involved in Fe transport
VAVAFNNTPFVRNRFFEQEFYDLQRDEVLRGPQGNLYGLNATAGVVNLISQKPKFSYEAKLSADASNYSSSRLEGMLNIPLVDDKVALRIAGAWTKREGYDTNQLTGNQIDGRDLWSTRTSLRFEPTDNIHANLIWEHFQEDDDRIRSGKQLCHTDEVSSITAVFPGADPHVLNGVTETFQTTHYQTLPEEGQPLLFSGVQGTFSQGCKPASLYSPDSFETPNGLSVPYYAALSAVGLPAALDDPYVSRTQSRDLRTIESTVDPVYKAKSDIVELQVAYDINDALTVTSETAYGTDRIFSMQDFNRFNTAPGAWSTTVGGAPELVARGILDENGVFCDPQIGCSDRLVGIDVSTAKSVQFSEELRLASNFDGPFNFSLGGNFLRYDTEDKYYVMFNSLSMYAAGTGTASAEHPYVAGQTDNYSCLPRGLEEPDFNQLQEVTGCVYMDPNPISSLNDQGHNYFLSRNPYKLISYAVFGEAYYNFTENLKLTAGLRWTVDRKEAPRIPSWVLSARNAGYPVANVVEQEWREPTGRLAIDWKPDLSFTDQTLLYASFAHGYKAGGANPPPAGLVMYCAGCVNEGTAEGIVHASATQPQTFDPEFVNAFELGSKNTLLDGRMTLNLAAFYYDYTGYQISQIVNRSAVNLNFDAKIWGLEIETDWRPMENLRLGFKGGYESTRVADGMKAIDTMDRTAGHAGWVTVSPFPTFPSNCILPAFLFAGVSGYFNGSGAPGSPELVNLGNPGGGGISGCELAYIARVDPVTGLEYRPNPTVATHPGALPTHPGYVGWDPTYDYGNNNGEGFFKDLSGKELPNAPHFTATITADYTIPLANEWLATLHTDLYYQSEAWTRIFNTPGYDKLKAYTNVNFAAIFSNDDLGWKVMAYVKNVFDRDSITGAFLNSDDTGLTTNVFLTEPRLYGVRVTKDFAGGPWWTGANPNHAGPFPLTVELGGQVQRQDAPNELIVPSSFAALPDALNSTAAAQDRDLDWGDGRSVKLTYQPDGSPWKVSAGVRYGKTNRATTRLHSDFVTTYHACAFVAGTFGARFLCDPASPAYNPLTTNYTATSLSDVTSRSHEEHTIVDFAVGRDVDLGLASTFGLGLRYASLDSHTDLDGRGKGGWIVPDAWFNTGVSAVGPEIHLRADREFKGFGPTLNWDAAARLFGSEEQGHLDLDWSITGGVLFGKQKADITGTQVVQAFHGIPSLYAAIPAVGDPVPSDATASHSKSVSVPVVDASLGLSYAVQRVKVSTGYRWERYYDAIDGGYQEHKSYDRTFDGPYFKIAVGFGG